jgi:hypothetical protein
MKGTGQILLSLNHSQGSASGLYGLISLLKMVLGDQSLGTSFKWTSTLNYAIFLIAQKVIVIDEWRVLQAF